MEDVGSASALESAADVLRTEHKEAVEECGATAQLAPSRDPDSLGTGAEETVL